MSAENSTEVLPDLDDLLNADFEMDDEGEIVLPAPVQQPTGEQSTEGVMQPQEEAAPQHDFEKRYNDLLPEFTRRSQELAELNKSTIPGMQAQINQLREGNSQPAENAVKPVDVPEDLIGTLQDPAAGAQLIMDLATKVVEQRMGEFVTRVAPMLDDYEIEQELRSVALAVGNEDFFELLPQIRQIISRSESDLSFADALEIARTFKGVEQPQTTSTEDGQEPALADQPRRVSAEEIAQQAARNQPETSVAGEVQEPPVQADTVEDAVNAAIDEVYG